MRVLFRIFILTLLLFIIPLKTAAQTCSCAVNPIYDPAEFSKSVSRDIRWSFELTLRYHSIGTFDVGASETEQSATGSRTAGSMMLQTRYFVSNRLSLALSTGVNYHYRMLSDSSNSGENASGCGDTFLSFQYLPRVFSKKSSTEIAFGAGVKAPSGRSDAGNSKGLFPEDMQPGTGSWDFGSWLYLNWKIPPANSYILYGGLSFRFNGENSRDYRFGHVITAVLGIRDQRDPISFSIHGKYKFSFRDRFAGSNVLNTGGRWLCVVPGAVFKINKRLGLKTELEVPVYRNLNGENQYTSTIQIIISFYYNLFR